MARIEILGAVFIISLGSLLHFSYEAAERVWWVGIFSAMNESVWEHLKLSFWPGAIWTLFLWLGPVPQPKNFWTGRAASLALTPFLIAIGFYGYTAALGGHFLAVDLALFVIAVACGQAAAVAIYRRREFSFRLEKAMIGLIVLMLTAFSTLSFYPPNIPLFEDPTTQTLNLNTDG